MLLSRLRCRVRVRRSGDRRRGCGSASRVYSLRRKVMREVITSSITSAVKNIMKVLQQEVRKYSSQLILTVIYCQSPSMDYYWEEGWNQKGMCVGYQLKQVLRYFSVSCSCMSFIPTMILRNDWSSLRFILIQCVEKIVQLFSSSINLAVSNKERVSLRDPSFRSVSIQKSVGLRDGFAPMQTVKMSLQQLDSWGQQQRQLQLPSTRIDRHAPDNCPASNWHRYPMKPSGHRQRPAIQFPPLRQLQGQARVQDRQGKNRDRTKSACQQWPLNILLDNIITSTSRAILTETSLHITRSSLRANFKGALLGYSWWVGLGVFWHFRLYYFESRILQVIII